MSIQSQASRMLRLVEEPNSRSDSAIETQIRRYYENERLSDEKRKELKAMLFACAPKHIERTAAGRHAADGMVFPHGIHPHD